MTSACLVAYRKTAGRGAELSSNLVGVWRRNLGPRERAFMLATAIEAAEPEDLEEFVFALGGPPPFGKV